MKLADLFEDIEDQHMLLKDWEVMTASHCLKGKLYNRPGHADGKTFLTKPIIHIRLMGEHQHPVAFTTEGGVFWLGDPKDLDKGENFVMQKMKPGSEQIPKNDLHFSLT